MHPYDKMSWPIKLEHVGHLWLVGIERASYVTSTEGLQRRRFSKCQGWAKPHTLVLTAHPWLIYPIL